MNTKGGMSGKHHSKATIRKMSKVMSGKNHPFYGKHHTEEAKSKMSKAKSGKNNPLYGKHLTRATRKKMSRAHIGKYHTEVTIKKISKAKSGKYLSKEHKKRLSKIAIKRWRTKEYQSRIREARSLKPNKVEQKLYNLLKELTFRDYKYVGDLQFFLGGKNPDFMNVNGQKKLIELYGKYWHDPKKFPKRQTPKQRIEYFKKYGFDTLVIEESELKNLEEVTNKVLLFNYMDIEGENLLY